MLYEGFLGKYVADAFDGKTLWLLLGEEELRGRYQYGTQSPQVNRYSRVRIVQGTPYGQNGSNAADFNDNIPVVENYKNIRDLK